MTQGSQALIWLDLEMTGLDPDNDHIIEIATIVTDAALQTIAEGPVVTVHQSNEVLDAMDAWNQEHHGKSGLSDRVRASEHSAEDAERITLEFLEQHSEPRSSPMCGNSICQDRRFMYRRMPKLEAFFHYRNLDVSTVKELCTRWAPSVAAGLTKQSTHTAMQDIRDSIDELRYYREHFFRIA